MVTHCQNQKRWRRGDVTKQNNHLYFGYLCPLTHGQNRTSPHGKIFSWKKKEMTHCLFSNLILATHDAAYRNPRGTGKFQISLMLCVIRRLLNTAVVPTPGPRKKGRFFKRPNSQQFSATQTHAGADSSQLAHISKASVSMRSHSSAAASASSMSTSSCSSTSQSSLSARSR